MTSDTTGVVLPKANQEFLRQRVERYSFTLLAAINPGFQLIDQSSRYCRNIKNLGSDLGKKLHDLGGD